MPEQKWFDPARKRNPYPVLNSLLPVSVIDKERVSSLLANLSKHKNEYLAHFEQLSRMTDVQRLNRNLKTLLDVLVKKEIRSVVNDGLTERDRKALLSMENTKYSSGDKETAQSLLNIPERYQALQVLGCIYRHERKKGRTED